MIFESEPPALDPRRAAIRDALAADETATVEALLPQAAISADANARVAEQARKLVIAVREKRNTLGGLDAFMHEYDLASDEGVMLMCLAEALLRIPDADTADRLIRDKLVQ